MILLKTDFKEFLRLLNDHEVRYLLVGGYAVAYHGYPRATADMDIWVETVPENAEKMVIVLKKFGFNVPDLSPELFMKENQIIRMGVPPIRIEVITSASGVKFNECWENRITEVIEGEKVNIIDLIRLKINKKASGRHKDLNDLENLP